MVVLRTRTCYSRISVFVRWRALRLTRGPVHGLCLFKKKRDKTSTVRALPCRTHLFSESCVSLEDSSDFCVRGSMCRAWRVFAAVSFFIKNSQNPRGVKCLHSGVVVRDGRAFHSRIPVFFERSEKRGAEQRTPQK